MIKTFRGKFRPWHFFSIFAMVLVSCAPATSTTKPAAIVTTAPASDAPSLPVRWRVHSARRQVSFVKMELPVVMAGMRVEVGTPSGPSGWIGGVSIFSSRVVRGAVSGPAVEQLTGNPQEASDLGSYLIATGSSGGSFVIREPMPLYWRVEVSALQDAGEYQFPVKILLPGREAEVAAMVVEVSDISLPTEPRVLGVMTTTTGTLSRLFPATFGAINATRLDRGDPDQKGAVDELDALVVKAHGLGMGLFVEDIGPEVRVDEVGRVTVKWEGYDRLMQPYMDGSAFADRVPLPVWLAPVPPRRISDSPTQLRQYVAACGQHYVDRGWVATPAFLHPAMIGAGSNQAGPDDAAETQLRDAISQTLRLHMSHDMLAVTSPEAQVPQARLWAVEEGDPKLPPAGGMASEESVRSWPWVCAARSASAQVKGFVWRDAVEGAQSIGVDGAVSQALLVVTSGKAGAKDQTATAEPTLRMVWLNEGLNDTAMMGLLEHRSDPVVVQEMYAGIVGRTGIIGGDSAAVGEGYLYAGWLMDRSVWGTVPTMLEKLVLASDPGAAPTMSANDPNFLAAQLWLANARRPGARVSGFDLDVHGGRDGEILEGNVNVVVENPINSPVQMDARFVTLPGDMEMSAGGGDDSLRQVRGRRSINVPAYGMAQMTLAVSGHLDTLEAMGVTSPVELIERNGGAGVTLPVQLPVYRMRAVGSAIKVDGKGTQWPTEEGASQGKRRVVPMEVGLRYSSRPDLSAGVNAVVRKDGAPASARWGYDKDFVYVLVSCPQGQVSDERNNDWPWAGGVAGNRWWGTDGVQIQIGEVDVPIGATKKVVQLGFKPGGAMMARMSEVPKSGPLEWKDGMPSGGEVKYGMSLLKNDGRVEGYVVEAAIPRKWFAEIGGGVLPSWRVNVLRHRANDLASMSWSGPVRDDGDVGMMGLLVGVGE